MMNALNYGAKLRPKHHLLSLSVVDRPSQGNRCTALPHAWETVVGRGSFAPGTLYRFASPASICDRVRPVAEVESDESKLFVGACPERLRLRRRYAPGVKLAAVTPVSSTPSVNGCTQSIHK